MRALAGPPWAVRLSAGAQRVTFRFGLFGDAPLADGSSPAPASALASGGTREASGGEASYGDDGLELASGEASGGEASGGRSLTVDLCAHDADRGPLRQRAALRAPTVRV